VAELGELAVGRGDLLAEVAGVFEGACEGERGLVGFLWAPRDTEMDSV
jgi:hypothetical protein